MTFKTRIYHPDHEEMMLEERDDGSYYLQVGMAGIIIKNKDLLSDLRELVAEAFEEEDRRIYEEYFR